MQRIKNLLSEVEHDYQPFGNRNPLNRKAACPMFYHLRSGKNNSDDTVVMKAQNDERLAMGTATCVKY